jgi:hypothetical protein
MPTTKQFTALVDIPHAKIGNCSAILLNRLQCWRAADYQVQEATVEPAVAAVAATKDSPAVEAVEEKVSQRTYQLCAFHKNLETPTTA